MHRVWWLLTIWHYRLVTAGRLNHLFYLLWLKTFYVRFVFTASLCLCVAIRACVWHRKGCDGNAVAQTGYRHGSETPTTALGCGKTPLSPPESTPSHHNKRPAICRSVGMPPSAWVLALPTVWGHQKKRDRVMSPRQQQQQTKPHWNMLAIPETDAGQYLFLLPQNCLKPLHQCFDVRGKWKTIIMLYEWCWKCCLVWACYV